VTERPLGRDLPSSTAGIREAVRVVGFLRSLNLNSSQLALAISHMRAYARDHGLELVDICLDDGALQKPSAFSAALERLTTGESDALLVPTEHHLSVEADIRESLTWLVAQAGGAVLTMVAV
jgi:hypothetical protein